jgi:hypothetical protein
MLSLAETDYSISFGSGKDWLNLLVGVVPFIASSLALGAMIALTIRHHERVRVAITIIGSVALYAFFAWWCYDPNEWSWSQPIVSALYQFAPVVFFFVAPAFLGGGIIRWICWPLPRPSLWKHLTKR